MDLSNFWEIFAGFTDLGDQPQIIGMIAIGLVLIFLGIVFFDFDFLPLLALQILFINAFDEEMPAIGLGLDKEHGDLMALPPRPPGERILNRTNAFIVFSMATVMALVAFIIYLTHRPEIHIEYARTMVFATIVAMVIFHTYNFRSLRESLFRIGILDNRFLLFASLFIAGITLLVMYHPAMNRIFALIPLTPADWAVCIVAAFTTSIYMEIIKWLRKRASDTVLSL